MSTETDELRDIFLDVAGEETVTERQAEEPSREPVEDAEVAEAAELGREDGLADAVAGAEVGSESYAPS
ncbi:MAG: hypothetical protein ABEH77_09880 [Halobacteriaceae archaeon]